MQLEYDLKNRVTAATELRHTVKVLVHTTN
jgi:hypothetical protein